MRGVTTAVALAAFAAGSAAWAQEEAGTTQITEREVTHGYLANEVWGFKPQAGGIAYTDPYTSNATGRGIIGFGLEANLLKYHDRNEYGVQLLMPGWYIGPSTGYFYSHIGATGSNFVGSEAPAGNPGAGANFMLIPVDLKVGYNITDGFRVSGRAGGNVSFLSVASAMAGRGSSGSSWGISPNIGMDFEFGPVLIRPDLTFVASGFYFTGTAGAVIPFG